MNILTIKIYKFCNKGNMTTFLVNQQNIVCKWVKILIQEENGKMVPGTNQAVEEIFLFKIPKLFLVSYLQFRLVILLSL